MTIPEEAVTLDTRVEEVLDYRLGDYIHRELPTYWESRVDKIRGMLYVGLLLVVTAMAAFFSGRESLRYYPDPGAPSHTDLDQPIELQLILPTAPPVSTERQPRQWPDS